MTKRMTTQRGLLKTLLCLGLLLPAVSHARSSIGGNSGGGGNLCYLEGRPTLLEFADLQAQLTEPGVHLQPTDMTKLYGFSTFQHIYTGPLKDRVEAILKANETRSPILVSWLRKIAPALAFSLVSADIQVPVKADTIDQPACRNNNVRASVLYFPPLLAFVDVNQFNLLDLDSQAGMVLHESSRFLQLLLKLSPANKDQSSLPLDDARLQQVTRTLFDVYQGRSEESVDKEDLFAALEVLLTFTLRGADLCLEDVTFELARQDTSRNQKIREEMPTIFKQACELRYDHGSWSELKIKLLNLREQLRQLRPAKPYKAMAETLNRRIDANLLHPLGEKNLRQAITADIPEALDQLSMQIAYLQLSLSRVNINADEYFAYKNRVFLSMENRKALRDIEIRACSTRENVTEWLKWGAPSVRDGEELTLPDMISKPNKKCSNP